ncbi:MFS monosaccharide transporter [Botryosphaeria dothidea]|uniref:MFS monosaccharide transporter n=1 Tax=Botryosphaeria dothidea TaxID=55169 RepID=A0A8H4IXU4_9PEZI|nr:MFS monosaccharide transporter [Botryosphaeria dothidea]
MLDQRKKWMVALRLEKRALLIAVNCIAGLSIFFFGYDQGMMGGVNESHDYVQLMDFVLEYELYYIRGYRVTYPPPNATHYLPVITNTLLQGGIVAVYYLGTLLGCLLGGWTGERFGRITTIGLGTLWAIFYMFATLICVFTIDRIGRRWTLYWGSTGQAIAMFLVGGLSRGGLNATADGDGSAAGKWGDRTYERLLGASRDCRGPD